MISIIQLVLLGIALGMDCFSVSLAIGVMKKHFEVATMFSLALMFGFFQAIMPAFGWIATVYIGNYISAIDHWIAFGLLFFIGVKSIIAGCKHEEEPMFDPSKFIVMLTLAVATSIDALAVGVSFTCMGLKTLTDIICPILIIGLFSFGMSLTGNWLGILLGKKFHFPAEIIGGIILILIGINVIYEHLF
ncbi:MAG: manganese efflux pump MntP family protein [Bacteroidaceae bacterium]|nr:manganese efflux pump MntP family protein [Bacteroidaceae bacterium]